MFPSVGDRRSGMEHAEGFERRWWILGVLCLSLLIIVMDNTILNVALPTLVRKLSASESQLQWMVDAYTLLFAGLLLTMGNLGDKFGRRTTLGAGLAIFAVGSALSSFAGSPSQLIATRALMGVGAALIMPATLSILTNVFPPEERAKAIGIWAGISGVAIALGPVIGGFLLVHYWWGSIFLINVPVCIFALIVGRLLVPNSRDLDAQPLDPVGAGLSVIGLVTLVYGIIEAPGKGWTSGTIIGSLVVAAVILTAFVLWELHSDHPMLNVQFFKNPRFTAANISITLVFFALFGSIFFLTQYLQFVLGYTALQAGLRLTPMALVLMVVAPASGYWHVLGGLVIIAVGLSMSMVPATESIMGSLPPGKAGVGSAMNDTTREVGGALGVAILGSVLASHYTATIGKAFGSLPGPLIAAAKGSVGGAIQVGQQIGGQVGQGLVATAKSTFITAMGSSLEIAAAVALGGAVISALWLPNRPPHVAGHEAARDAELEPIGTEIATVEELAAEELLAEQLATEQLAAEGAEA